MHENMGVAYPVSNDISMPPMILGLLQLAWPAIEWGLCVAARILSSLRI